MEAFTGEVEMEAVTGGVEVDGTQVNHLHLSG